MFGVPIGVLSGLVAIFVLLKIVGAIIGEYLFDGIDGILFGVNAIPIVIAVILRFCYNISISIRFSKKGKQS